MNTRDLLIGSEVNARPTDAGLAALRVFAGLALALLHGIGKVPPQPGFVSMVGGMGMPAPELFAWLAGIAEFVGGLLLAIGLLTRPAAALVFGHFLIVVFVAHAGDSLSDRELPIFFGVTALLLLLSGAGRYSVDALLRGRRA